MLLCFLLLLRVISWFESHKCMIKPYHHATAHMLHPQRQQTRQKSTICVSSSSNQPITGRRSVFRATNESIAINGFSGRLSNLWNELNDVIASARSFFWLFYSVRGRIRHDYYKLLIHLPRFSTVVSVSPNMITMDVFVLNLMIWIAVWGSAQYNESILVSL